MALSKYCIGLGFLIGFISVSLAKDLTVYVAPKSSAAYATAAAQVDNDSSFTERKIHKAFNRAAQHLLSCGACVVTIKIAGAEYQGKTRTGQWVFPDVKAPEGRLYILGGYDASFAKRKPFSHPTKLIVSKPRSGHVLRFQGKKHALKELVVSGFAIDVSPGNSYDPKTNSLLKGSSSSWGLLSFGYLTTDRLIVSDNVFMNAANGVAAPAIRKMTDNSEVIVRNNFFLNNVFNWSATSANSLLGKYVFENNSFIMNWPYNPDTGTANPGALEIGNRYTAKLVEIKSNIFAYNPGGAIHPQWDDANGPQLSIENNVFFKNGTMFKESVDREGMIVGKFNGGAQHKLYAPEDVEDDFDWTVNDNAVLDPGISVPVLKLTALGDQAEHNDEETVAVVENDSLGQSLEEPLDELPDDDYLSELDLSDLELNDDFAIDEWASDGQIKNYAPMMPFNREILSFYEAAGVNKDMVFKF